MSTCKRDALIEEEKRVQEVWATQKVFESNPSDAPKFFANFPFPYMNGRLHLGHCYSLSKCEFAVSFQRLLGKNVLWPFAFHCTGQPIKACAEKLQREMAVLGESFTGETTNQWQIMLSMGLKREELKEFIDPLKWFEYFPPLAQEDVTRFGGKVDWRRSFITTDVNPYFDSFVRWQFNKLHELGKVKFGERYTIWSPKDNEPCMDHDRQSGEGVCPQEYTVIKLKVLDKMDIPGNVYLVAATLRPETMYGQTNCYVSPTINYGMYSAEDSIYVCTERAARNMAYQRLVKTENKEPVRVGWIKGTDLFGLRVKAPLTSLEFVYVLPMPNILPAKGTGIVTSVPSDSPDDMIMLRDLQKKPEYYEIKAEWANVKPISIIRSGYGDFSAEYAITELKINSPKDHVLLEKAKEMVYKEGFYSGTLLVGEFKGMPVAQAKPLVRKQLIDNKEAFAYCEPEKEVISRSGDSCVVSLCDQWFLDYGEEGWKRDALCVLEQTETFHPEVRALFEKTIDWLQQWACARSFGLGTRLPWDESWLIESLSDSTVYMAYYTVCHLLHKDFYGRVPGELGIKPEEMTDAVWDHVLLGKSIENPQRFTEMRKQFEYYYPFDLRASGKDLIPNHLTFLLYNHACIFKSDKWPKSIRGNGHLLLNSEKMSKSLGNFMTLAEAIDKYGADATRVAIADAGDGLEDANFVEATANAAILRLFTQREWAMEAKLEGNRKHTYLDRVFLNSMHDLVSKVYDAYSNMRYRDALKYAFFEFQDARDWYRESCGILCTTMNPQLVRTFIEFQCIILSPICPHWAEYIWKNVLLNSTLVINARWPEFEVCEDKTSVLASASYIKTLIHEIRANASSATKAAAKKKDLIDLGCCKLYVASDYPQWQKDIVAKMINQENVFAKENRGKYVVGDMKRSLMFITELKRRTDVIGFEKAITLDLGFNEIDTLNNAKELIEKSLEMIIEFQIVDINSSKLSLLKKKGEGLLPGKPIIEFKK